MSSLNSKSIRIAAFIGCTVAMIGFFISPTPTTKGLLLFASLITAFSQLMAEMKKGHWIQVNWIWSSFFLPHLILEIIVIDLFVQFLIIKWLFITLLVYFTLLPIVMAFGVTHLTWACKQL